MADVMINPQMRFAPRSSGQITSVFDLGWFESIFEDLFIKPAFYQIG